MLESLLQWVKDNGTAGAAILAASVALIVFLLTRIAETIALWWNRRSTRKRIVIGLFREVRANINTIEKFLDASPHPGDLREKVKNDLQFRPLVIIEENTQFYDAITPSLPEVDSACLIALSRFYATIREQKAIAAAFESAAFLTISAEGRTNTVDDLWRGCRLSEKEGLKALYELELAYPRRWFRDFRS